LSSFTSNGIAKQLIENLLQVVAQTRNRLRRNCRLKVRGGTLVCEVSQSKSGAVTADRR